MIPSYAYRGIFIFFFLLLFIPINYFERKKISQSNSTNLSITLSTVLSNIVRNIYAIYLLSCILEGTFSVARLCSKIVVVKVVIDSCLRVCLLFPKYLQDTRPVFFRLVSFQRPTLINYETFRLLSDCNSILCYFSYSFTVLL